MADISVETRVNLPEKFIDAFTKTAELKTYKAGDILFSVGDPSEYVYLVKSGIVRICHYTVNGICVTLLLHGKGELIGLGAAIDSREMSVFAVIVRDDTQLLRIRAEEFRRLMKNDCSFATGVAVVLSRRMKALDVQVLRMVSIGAQKRIPVILFDLATKEGIVEGDKIRINITQQEIADYLGTCRQTTSVMLTGLKDSGIISVKRGHIIVNDILTLQKRALESQD